jgi:2-polyprenyl-3-methyl-5-hydroxy-6-metoxy-1,4-benzoquinol methylase
MIFITGIPGAGKTTMARKLAEFLHYDLVCTDYVYFDIAKSLGRKDRAMMEFANPAVWKEQEGIDELKSKFYPSLLEGKKPDRLIVEGYGLSFAKDRQLIEQIAGQEADPVFVMGVGYDTWLKRRNKEHSLDTRAEYDRLIGWGQLPKEFYPIDSHTELCVRDQKVYSGLKSDFVQNKFEALKLTDLKGKSVLDLGGNDGTIARLCLGKGAAYVLVVDANWRHLQRAKGLNRYLLDLNHIEKLQGQWDVVLSVSMIHYLPDQERFIRECARLAKERFVLELPVFQEQGLKTCWDRPEGTIKPTPALVLKWLSKYFIKVEMVGPSVSPDSSHRLVFHAWK